MLVYAKQLLAMESGADAALYLPAPLQPGVLSASPVPTLRLCFVSIYYHLRESIVSTFE